MFIKTTVQNNPQFAHGTQQTILSYSMIFLSAKIGISSTGHACATRSRCTVVGNPGGSLGFWPNSFEGGTCDCQKI